MNNENGDRAVTARIEAPEHRACRQRADDEHVPARDDHRDNLDHLAVAVG